MGKAPPLQQDILDAYMKPVSLQYFAGFGTLPCRKRGPWGNLIHPCMIPSGGDSLGGWEGCSLTARTGLLPSMSEWMTSTNCASPGSNLSSGGLPLNKGPAGSRPGKKTELAWQPHAVSHPQPGFGSLPVRTANRLQGTVGWASTHIPIPLCQAPLHSPVAFSHRRDAYPGSAPWERHPDPIRSCILLRAHQQGVCRP